MSRTIADDGFNPDNMAVEVLDLVLSSRSTRPLTPNFDSMSMMIPGCWNGIGPSGVSLGPVSEPSRPGLALRLVLWHRLGL